MNVAVYKSQTMHVIIVIIKKAKIIVTITYERYRGTLQISADLVCRSDSYRCLLYERQLPYYVP